MFREPTWHILMQFESHHFGHETSIESVQLEKTLSLNLWSLCIKSLVRYLYVRYVVVSIMEIIFSIIFNICSDNKDVWFPFPRKISLLLSLRFSKKLVVGGGVGWGCWWW